MSAQPVKVCPACRRPARNRPLPPDGFWQEQVLQRIGMYPYRCEACGARFYRKVAVGDRVAPPRRPETHAPPPIRSPAKRPSEGPATEPSSPATAPARPTSPGSSKRAASASAGPPPRVLTDPDLPGHAMSHADFIDLIDHIKEAERREGLDVHDEDDEEK